MALESAPADVAATLDEFHAITLKSAEAADLAAAVDPAWAVRVAQRVGGGATRDTPSLVRFTDRDYGEADDDAAFVSEPIWSDKLAWLVVLQGAWVARHGPIGSPGGFLERTLAVFVEAETGRFLIAMTVD
jgi:hypothetical protein